VGEAVVEPDPQVVAAARRGDLDAFAELVRRYQAEVWRLSLHLVRDPGLADDVAQDAFVRAFRFLPRYRGEARFSTWLFTITRNCALDELRRAGRRRRLRDDLDALGSAGPAELGTRLEVRDALGALPVELREPVVLIDMFGVTYGEVAALLRVPVGTIKSRVHRARALLAHALAAPATEVADGG
jgi:RNA polymerase sigma-70 factor (ECF subfamily)